MLEATVVAGLLALGAQPTHAIDKAYADQLCQIFSQWQTSTYDTEADMNGDGVVDVLDVQRLFHRQIGSGGDTPGPSIEGVFQGASLSACTTFPAEVSDGDLLVIFGGTPISLVTPSIGSAAWNGTRFSKVADSGVTAAFAQRLAQGGVEDAIVCAAVSPSAVHGIAVAIDDIDPCTPVGSVSEVAPAFTNSLQLTLTTSAPGSLVIGAILLESDDEPNISHKYLANTSFMNGYSLHVQASEILADANEQVVLTWDWNNYADASAVAIEVLARPDSPVTFYPWASVRGGDSWAKRRDSLYRHPAVEHQIIAHMGQYLHRPPGFSGGASKASVQDLVNYVIEWQAHAGYYRDDPEVPQAKGSMFFRNGSSKNNLPIERFVDWGPNTIEVIWDGFTMHPEDALPYPNGQLSEDNAQRVIFNSNGIAKGKHWWETFASELETALEAHDPPLCHPHLHLDIEHRNNRAGSIGGGQGDLGWWHYAFDDPRADTEVVFRDSSGVGYTLVDLWGSTDSSVSGPNGPLFRTVDVPASPIDLTGVNHWNHHPEFRTWITDMGRQVMSYAILEATEAYRNRFPDALLSNYQIATYDDPNLPAISSEGDPIYRANHRMDTDAPVLYGPNDDADIQALKSIFGVLDDRPMAMLFNLRFVDAAFASSGQPRPVIPWVVEHSHSREWLDGPWGVEYQISLWKALYDRGVREILLWGNQNTYDSIEGHYEETESMLDEFLDWVLLNECSKS